MGTLTLREQINQSVQDLPTLPTVAIRVIELMGDDSHSTDEMVRIVSSDASLTAHVLRIANSVAFARRVEITSLSRAIIHLGEKIVVGIAISTCASELFTSELKGYEASPGSLWDHSLRTAIAAREIAGFSRQDLSSDEAFTAGLLHDIGKTIISKFVGDRAHKLVELYDGGDFSDFREAERELVGMDHTAIGLVLAEKWNLPRSLAEVIANHHEPSKADQDYLPLIYSVHLGDLISMMGGTGTGVDTLAYNVDNGYIDHFKIAMKDIDRILLTVDEEFTKIREFIVPNVEAQNG